MKNYSQNSKLQKQPEETDKMKEKPITLTQSSQKLGDELKNKTAIITGGDSGIGQAIALLYAKFGINIMIVYYDEDMDAKKTMNQVLAIGGKCESIKGDIRDVNFCEKVIERTMKEFGSIDILINNASVQYPQDKFENISHEQLMQTFSVNVFGMFYITKFALKYLKEGGCIINTSSITAFRGSEHLVDYAATKAAIIGFTRSMAKQLAPKKIRVNAVAPGPIITPLIPSSFDEQEMEKFGTDTLLRRPGQPYEVAPSYLFLILRENSYMTGQVLHPNGGEIVA